MMVTVVLSISIVLQLTAAVIAVWLIRITGRRLAWSLVATSIVLMVVRRSITLYAVWASDEVYPSEARAEFVALVISAAMVAGLALIVPLFRSIRRTEQNLRESRRSLSTLISNLPGMAYRCRNDRDWTLEFISEGCLELTGYNPSDMIDSRTLSYSDLIHPDDRETVWEDVQQAVATREPFRLTYRIRTSSGQEKWVWEQGRGVFDEDGELLALEGFITDITERHHVELELQGAYQEMEARVQQRTHSLSDTNALLQKEIREREAAERDLRRTSSELESIFRVVPDLYFRLGADGTILGFKAGDTTNLYAPPDQFLGKRMIDVLPTDAASAFQNTVRRALDTRTLETVEYELDLPKGRRAFEARMLPLGDDQIIAIVRDVTEQRCAAAKIGCIAQEHETLLRHACDFVYRHGTDGVFTYVSPAVERITGYPVDDWCKHYTAYLTDNPVNDLVVVHTEETLRTGKESPPYLVEIRHKQGHAVMLEVNEQPYFEGKRIAGIIGVARDVTERIRHEVELKEAKEAAEAANRTKSAFLANISHEIRTPVTAMLNATELLGIAQQTPGAQNVERTDIILRNGRHLLALIDDILESSRAEAGRLSVHPRSCSLPDLLADVLAVTDPLHDRAAVELAIVYETPVPTEIHTDPVRLKQALINLVGNALKFTQAGCVQVRVSAAPESPEPRLCLAVEDTGRGIAPEDLNRIFETFTQVGQASATVSRGVGLGLPLTKTIAGLLGGDIQVASSLGRGSTFTLRITTGPLDKVEWLDPGKVMMPAPNAQPGRSTNATSLSGNVLLADDFTDTRELIRQALIECGVSVTGVDNGEKALEAASAKSFDLILMDIRMPGMDGLAATKALRERGCLAPIVALTASTDRAERAAILEAGFDDLWHKPLSLADLIEGVAAFLPAAGPKPDPQDQGSPGSSPTVALRATGISAQLAELRRDFALHLPGRVAELSALLQAGKSQLAAELLHQLVGGCGVHGFADLSNEAARLLEGITEGVLTLAADAATELERMSRAASESVRVSDAEFTGMPARDADG